MTDQQVSNLNVLSQDVLITPEALKQEIPLTEAAERTVIEGRETIQRILDGEDPRLLVVVGPCSIHDVDAALDYARRLRRLAERSVEPAHLTEGEHGFRDFIMKNHYIRHQGGETYWEAEPHLMRFLA